MCYNGYQEDDMKEYNWHGLTVKYEIESLGYQGDASLPGGLNYLGDVVGEMWVYTPDGYDITEDITEFCYEEIAEEIMRETC